MVVSIHTLFIASKDKQARKITGFELIEPDRPFVADFFVAELC